MGESVEHADIEAMLDKVALAMADGDNKEAMRLLPEIIASGDDIQRQMAESYQMQLAVLLEMEAETDELAELIDAKQTDDDALSTVQSSAAEAEVADNAAEQITTVESEDITADALATGQDELELEAQQQDDAAVSDKDDSQTDVDEVSSIQADVADDAGENAVSRPEKSEAKAEISTISSVAQQLDETEQLPLAAETIENEVDTLFETALQMTDSAVEKDKLPVSDVDTQTIDTSESIAQETEVDLALEQVAILLSDGEYETASLLLGSILENGNELQRQIAETYAQQIAVLSAPLEQDHDDSLTVAVGDSFDDEEDVSNLQAPTQALNAFDLSSEHLLSQSAEREDKGERFQRQAFFIGDIGLMIAFADGSELTEMPTYYPVPNAPDWLLGLTNLHGVIIPVFDLVRFWGLSEHTSGKPMLLVLQQQENAIGVIINGLPRRLTWVESQKVEKNTSPPRLSKHISAAYLINEQLWFDLDSVALTGDLQQAISH
ncbi:MAG: hypothetical protein CR975_05905 [Gammaproteobacteria bacterium]|nr:MAG: hypothetical protein CR975_05905 [Gammaproteobacteria bacterium]